MCRLSAAAALVLALAVPAHAKVGVTKCPAEGPVRASVVVIWSPAGNVEECRWFARRGYRTRVINAPPDFTWERDWCYLLKRIRRVPRPRYLYGWSRAGTIAAHIALLGEAEGALTAGAPTDLTRWWSQFPDYWEDMGMTEADRRWFSPLFNVPERRSVRMLLAHSPDDDVVPIWHSRKLHGRVRGSRFVRLDGRHGFGIETMRGETLRWLRKGERERRAAGERPAEESVRATRRCAAASG